MMDQLEDLVCQALTRAFDTMLDLEVAPEATGADLWNGDLQIAGSVGFVGRVSGVVYLYTSNRFARRITAGMVGMREDEIDGEGMVNDAIGELANMVVGQVKSKLSDRGMPCVLTVPSIVRGSHFAIETSSTTRRRVNAFRCDGHLMVVETLIKSA